MAFLNKRYHDRSGVRLTARCDKCQAKSTSLHLPSSSARHRMKMNLQLHDLGWRVVSNTAQHTCPSCLQANLPPQRSAFPPLPEEEPIALESPEEEPAQEDKVAAPSRKRKISRKHALPVLVSTGDEDWIEPDPVCSVLL